MARAQVRELCETAGDGLATTFHRAFDVCRDSRASLDTLIDIGLDRVLTSGQEATVPEALPRLASLHRRAADRITILPGCGITPENVASVLERTGCTEFHATAFARVESPMRYRNPKVYMGVPGLPEYERWETSEEEVRRFVAAAR